MFLVQHFGSFGSNQYDHDNVILDIIASFSIVKQHVKEPVLAMNAKIVKKYSCDMGKN